MFQLTFVTIGSDGTVYNLGTTTTNGYYGTFAFTWTPPKADSYQITASFAGDNSYGSSSAGTDITVGGTSKSISSNQQSHQQPSTLGRSQQQHSTINSHRRRNRNHHRNRNRRLYSYSERNKQTTKQKTNPFLFFLILKCIFIWFELLRC